MTFKHFFLPHPYTHKKAYLITPKAFVAYILLFFLLQNGLTFFASHNTHGVGGQVLAASTVMSSAEVIRLTNVAREKNGLADLKENTLLDTSAYNKAENMYAENYWAHYSPSGKDPWSFMKAAGYNFSYAGENLAKNFYTASDVVNAWMNSPSHRENMLNPHYTDIGVSVNDGMLEGQDTILVVQHFGSPAQVPIPTVRPVALVKQSTPQPTISPISQTEIASASATPSATPILLTQTQPPIVPPVQTPVVSGLLFDPHQVSQTVGTGLLGFVALLIGLDLYVMRQQLVYRLTTHHLSHFALLSVAATGLVHMGGGQVL